MSTLIEELEEAIDGTVCFCDGEPVEQCAECQFADRLGQRIRAIRDWDRELESADKLPLRPGVADVFKAITGPLTEAAPPVTVKETRE